MSRPISIYNETPVTNKVNTIVRKTIAKICKSEGTQESKIAKVKNYLANNRSVKAIIANGNTLTVHTSGSMASSYTYSI